MQNFTQKIVWMMKSKSLFQWQGGPIIIAQIENEFGPLEWDQGDPTKAYATWAVKMAVDLDTGIPWIICKYDDAPDPVTNAWKVFYAEDDEYSPNKPYKPSMWTKAWIGCFGFLCMMVPGSRDLEVRFLIVLLKTWPSTLQSLYKEGCLILTTIWSNSGDCVSFLANYDTQHFVKVAFNVMHYDLPLGLSASYLTARPPFSTLQGRKSPNWRKRMSH